MRDYYSEALFNTFLIIKNRYLTTQAHLLQMISICTYMIHTCIVTKIWCNMPVPRLWFIHIINSDFYMCRVPVARFFDDHSCNRICIFSYWGTVSQIPAHSEEMQRWLIGNLFWLLCTVVLLRSTCWILIIHKNHITFYSSKIFSSYDF